MIQTRDTPTLSDLTSYAFDDGSTPSPDYGLFYAALLFHVFTPRILKELPAFQSRIPSEVLCSLPKDLPQPSGRKDFSENVYRWHLHKAVSVLKGYSACDVPLTTDTRVPTTPLNLLSTKGRILFRKLTALEKHPGPRFSSDLKDVFSAGHKLYLDFDLFIRPDISPLLKFEKKAVALLSSGCYNNCVHCGYGPTEPVRHTPYPLYMNIIRALKKEGSLSSFTYLNSDPIFYKDRIIDADVGDVFFRMKDLGFDAPFMVTKGILQDYTKTALLKLPYSALSRLTFSLVNLPGENVSKNIERIKESARLARLSDLPFNIQYYEKNDPQQKEPLIAKAFNITPPSAVLGIVPTTVGNWALNNPDIHNLYDTTNARFGLNECVPVFSPDGSVATYLLSLKDRCFHPVVHGNLFKDASTTKKFSIRPARLHNARIG